MAVHIGDLAAPRIEELVRSAYRAYSGQRLDELASLFTVDVDYPAGAHRLHGIEAVRRYWSEQWTRTRTVDTPVTVALLGPDVVSVLLDQVVRTTSGELVSEGRFVHILRIDDGRFSRLDIVAI